MSGASKKKTLRVACLIPFRSETLAIVYVYAEVSDVDDGGGANCR